MRRFIASLTLFALLVLSTPVLHARDWSAVVRKVHAATVHITFPMQALNPFTGEIINLDASCSGFVINKAKGYVMTAHHCLNNGTTDELKIVDAPAGPMWLVFADESIDLAIISVPKIKGWDALKPSQTAIRQGQEIGAFGYANGWHRPIFRAGYVASTSLDLGFPDFPGQWAVFDGVFVGGMSGGPIFNVKGEVVGVVQIGTEELGMWRPFSVIYKASKAYWG